MTILEVFDEKALKKIKQNEPAHFTISCIICNNILKTADSTKLWNDKFICSLCDSTLAEKYKDTD